MTAKAKMVEELGVVSGPVTLEDRLKALREVQTLLVRSPGAAMRRRPAEEGPEEASAT